jgi:hypothetical protein
MRLTSISANHHIFEGRVHGKPLRLLLNFDSGRSLRLAVAGDGEQMIADQQPLDEPFEMGAAGAVVVVDDVTEALGVELSGEQVEDIRFLNWHGRRVGVRLALATGAAFHIWVDGDELHWGNIDALSSHQWLGGTIPSLGDRVEP